METQSYYDKIALVYEHHRHYGYHKFLDDLEVEVSAKYVEGREVLEVGCGTGLIMKRLSGTARRLLGADLSVNMLRAAASRGLKVVQADACRLPFRDATFDAVLCFKVLAHVRDAERALAEMARVLRPGGHMVIEFYNRHSLRYLVKRLKRATRVVEEVTDREVYTRYDSLSEVQDLLPRGLRVVATNGIRVLAPAAFLFNMPVLGPIVTRVETALSRSRLGRLGGFLEVVARKD